MRRLVSLALAGVAFAVPGHSAVIQYYSDPEPMVVSGEPGPYTARVLPTGINGAPAIEFVRRPGRVSFSRMGVEQCFDKLAGPVDCEVHTPVLAEQEEAETVLLASISPVWEPTDRAATGRPLSDPFVWVLLDPPPRAPARPPVTPDAAPSPVNLPAPGLLLAACLIVLVLLQMKGPRRAQ